MLETSTVSGFNTASILSLGNLQINVKLHLSCDPIRDPWNRHQPVTVHFSHPYLLLPKPVWWVCYGSPSPQQSTGGFER